MLLVAENGGSQQFVPFCTARLSHFRARGYGVEEGTRHVARLIEGCTEGCAS